ncbi:MAG: NUDIX hydrolase [Mycobacteriales bacterium]
MESPGRHPDLGYGKPAHEHGWAERFPVLFARSQWNWGGITAQFGPAEPPDALVGNVHVVARCGARVVVCRNDLGWRFLPGGTREPDEPIIETARRELVEEAGATLLGGWRHVGAFRGELPGAGPYRPHLPHPVSYWLYAVADVRIDGVPTNPPGGENVVEVRVLPAEVAAAWLSSYDEQTGDIVRLAAARGLV